MTIKPRATIKSSLKPVRAGDVFLIAVPNYWGKGGTLREAKSGLRGVGGNLAGEWIVYSVHPDTYVNPHGQLAYPAMHPAIKLQENKYKIEK